MGTFDKQNKKDLLRGAKDLFCLINPYLYLKQQRDQKRTKTFNG